MRWKILGAHRARCTGGPRSASAAARSLKNAKRKRGSAQPQEREAQARQRAASRTRSASAAARSLKNAKRKRGSAQPQEIDRPYSTFIVSKISTSLQVYAKSLRVCSIQNVLLKCRIFARWKPAWMEKSSSSPALPEESARLFRGILRRKAQSLCCITGATGPQLKISCRRQNP